MTEIKTNETINVFPCTYILISRAIRPLDHETITKICQQDEDFQKRVLDLLINIGNHEEYDDDTFIGYSCGSAKIISSTKMIQTVISFMLNYKDDTDHIMLVR